MPSVKELITSLKGILKENLNESNLEFITKVDKELDNISVEHDKTEESLTQTKDKLIEVVKNTSFKSDSEPSNEPSDTDKPMTIDEALESAIKEAIQARK